MHESVLSACMKSSAQRGVAKTRIVYAYSSSYGSYAAPIDMSDIALIYKGVRISQSCVDQTLSSRGTSAKYVREKLLYSPSSRATRKL